MVSGFVDTIGCWYIFDAQCWEAIGSVLSNCVFGRCMWIFLFVLFCYFGLVWFCGRLYNTFPSLDCMSFTGLNIIDDEDVWCSSLPVQLDMESDTNVSDMYKLYWNVKKENRTTGNFPFIGSVWQVVRNSRVTSIVTRLARRMTLPDSSRFRPRACSTLSGCKRQWLHVYFQF